MYKVNIELTSKRKPSRALIMRTIAEYLKQGITNMEVNWGENWLDLEYHGKWIGSGWIKDIGGDDIANELNQMQKQASIESFREFMKDHMTIAFIK